MASSVTFQLPANLTIANAHGLHEQFEGLVDTKDCDHLVIHGHDVQRVDTAGIQLLLALVVATRDRQIVVSWDHPSDALESAANILGLDKSLGWH